MNQLVRMILGSLLFIAGLAGAAMLSFLLCALLPSLAEAATAMLGFSLMEWLPASLYLLLVLLAAGALSGCLLLLAGLAAGRLNQVEFEAWPNLSSLWLTWVAAHFVLWFMPSVMAW